MADTCSEQATQDYPRLMRWTSTTAKQARARSHGLRRAAFWRALGWPNLKLATEARLRKQAKARLEAKKR